MCLYSLDHVKSIVVHWYFTVLVYVVVGAHDLYYELLYKIQIRYDKFRAI